MPCGIKPSLSRIIGGVEATPYSIPWQVLLGSCGGTLISSRHVVTARHCGITTGRVAIVGEHDLRNASDGRDHKICAATNHPHYDISVLHLQPPVQMGLRTVRACLPTLKHAGDFLASKLMTVSGWGSTSATHNNHPNKLHVVNVTGVTLATCREKYNDLTGNQVTDGDICAGDIIDGGEDSCQGDSGGTILNCENYE